MALEGVGRLDDSVTQLQELLRKESTNAPAQKMLSRLCLEAKERQSADLSPLAEAQKVVGHVVRLIMFLTASHSSCN